MELVNIKTWIAVMGFGLSVAVSLAQLDPRVPSDDFPHPQRLTVEEILIQASNLGKTTQPGELLICSSSDNNRVKSVWWSWHPPRQGMVIVDLEGSKTASGAEMDTLVGLYIGKDFPELGDSSASTGPACNDDYGTRKTSRLLVNVFATDIYHIAVAGKSGVQEEGSIHLSLRLVTKPEIVDQPRSQAITVGQSATFSVTAIGFGAEVPRLGGTNAPPPLRYQWKLNGVNLTDSFVTATGLRVEGATTKELRMNTVPEDRAGNYTVAVSNEYGEVTSLSARLDVGIGPEVLCPPSGGQPGQRDQKVPPGGQASFKIEAFGKELNYQWQFQSVDTQTYTNLADAAARISGALTSTLTLSGVATNQVGRYRVRVFNSANRVESCEFTFALIDPRIEIVKHPASRLAGVREEAIFEVQARRADGQSNTQLRYQWYQVSQSQTNILQSNGGTVQVATASGGQSSTLRISGITAASAGQYFAAVSAQDIPKYSVASLRADLTVKELPLNDTFTGRIILPFLPTIKTNGYNFGATREGGEPFHVGESAERSVWWEFCAPAACGMAVLDLRGSAFLDASGSSSSGRLAVYEGNAVSSLKSARFKRDERDQLTFFVGSNTRYAIAVDGYHGAQGTVTLNLDYTQNVPPPLIKKNCQDGVFLACDPSFFSVEVESLAPISFKWQREVNSGGQATYVDLVDPAKYVTRVRPIFDASSTPELIELEIRDSQPEDVGVYRVLVESCGGETNSRVAKLDLRFPPEIRQQPQDLSLRECLFATFSVLADGCKPMLYQWYKNDVIILGKTNSTLVFDRVTTNDIAGYKAVATNPYGSITSRVADLTVKPLPVFEFEPQDASRRACETNVFRMLANESCGRPMSFQWFFNGKNLIRPNTISTNSDLVLPNVQTNDIGGYSVRVTNLAGSITSRVAQLSVDVGPWINSQPVDQVRIKLGDPINLDVESESCSPMRYGWYFTGSTIPPLTSYPGTVNHLVHETTLTNAIGLGGTRIAVTNTLIRTNPPSLAILGALGIETSRSLRVANATTNHSGFYSVIVSNDFGSIRSRLVRVNVFIPPSNDDYANRIPIPGTNALITGYNIFATRQTNEPIHLPGADTARSVWWNWTAPDDAGFLSISLAGTAFQSVLALYTNSPQGQLVQFARNPNSLNRIGLTDRTAVQIAVDGINSSQEGNIRLNLNFQIDTNPPSILRHPESIAIKPNTTARFAVEHKETPYVAYQWSFSQHPPRGTTITTFRNIPGATASSFVLANAVEADEGLYVVTLRNKYGEVRSEPGRLTLGAWVKGMVTDATNGRSIPGATVTAGDLAPGSENFLSTQTDGEGNYSLFGVKPTPVRAIFEADHRVIGLNRPVIFTPDVVFSAVTLIGQKGGYYNYEDNRFFVDQGGYITNEFAMSPVLIEGLRFVLIWGERVSDLDLVLRLPSGQEVSWQSRNSGPPMFAVMDFDVKNGRGPETITAPRFVPGTFSLYVQKGRATVGGTLINAQPIVSIYTDQTSSGGERRPLYEIHAPASGNGTLWHVCDIDGASRNITYINQYTESLIRPQNVSRATPPLEERGPSVRKHTISAAAGPGSGGAFFWQLDGATSVNRLATNRYASPGYKTISLTVSNQIGPKLVSYNVVKTDYVLVTNDPPTVSLVLPKNGVVLRQPATVTLVAEAADSDGTIDKVEFYGNKRLLGTASGSAPYLFTTAGLLDGSYVFTARAYDNFGTNTTSLPITNLVRDLTGQILIIRNRQDQEIDQMKEYLAGDGYTYQVLDQQGLTFDLVSGFDAIIWADTGQSGLDPNTVDVLRQAFAAGKHLYLVGELLAAEFNRLGASEDLTHLAPINPLLVPGSDTLLAIDPSGEKGRFDSRGVVYDGKFGTVEDFVYGGLIQGGRALGSFGETVLARASGRAALLSFTDAVKRNRIVTQAFRSLSTVADGGQDQTRLIFRNTMWWLLNGTDCSFLDFYLSDSGSMAQPDPAEVGGELTYDLQIIRGLTCKGRWVVVNNVFSSPVQFVRATNANASGSFQVAPNGNVTFQFENFDPARAKISFTVRPLAPGSLTNSISIVAGAEDNLNNNKSQIITSVKGLPSPPTLSIARSTQGDILFSVADAFPGVVYTVEYASVITAPMKWDYYSVLASSPPIRITLPQTNVQRFYRLKLGQSP